MSGDHVDRLPDNVRLVVDTAPGDVEDPCELTLLGHTSGVRCCCYSPDGALVASTAEDASLRVWDSLGISTALLLSVHTQSSRYKLGAPDKLANSSVLSSHISVPVVFLRHFTFFAVILINYLYLRSKIARSQVRRAKLKGRKAWGYLGWDVPSSPTRRGD